MPVLLSLASKQGTTFTYDPYGQPLTGTASLDECQGNGNQSASARIRLMRPVAYNAEKFPPMPMDEWADSKAALHRFLQIVGNIRLASAPRRNHWWHIPFHLTGRGITTRPMGSNSIFAIDFHFVDDRLIVSTDTGK